MKNHVPTPSEALERAAAVLVTRYPDADAAFVAGSLMRGDGSASSDVDLVVLYGTLERAYRESFLFQETPVESFVHDSETLTWFLEQDRKDGRPALIAMVMEGVLIGPRQEMGRKFKTRAGDLFAQGPPVLSKEALQRLRYAITDLLDDLEADRSRAEILAIGASLYPLLVELALRGNGRWNGNGKWSARLMSKMDEAIAGQLERAFLDLYEGSGARGMMRLADDLLEPHGGRLFSGYRSDAPAEWRSETVGGPGRRGEDTHRT